MRTNLCLIFSIPILLVHLAAAQANITMPKSPSPGADKDCHSTSKILPNGDAQFTDCSGVGSHVKRDTITGASNHDLPTTQSVSPEYSNPQTDEKYQEFLRAGLDYRVYSYSHAKRTFEWQYWSGQIIFWIAMLLVFAGVAFSAVQFYVGLPKGASEFEASVRGIKLKSSVLGLLILAMSMIFFYLYLKYVYPISNVSG